MYNPFIWHLFMKSQNFDRFKLKAFADDRSNVAKLMILVFDRVENIVGKGENAGYQHFLLFPSTFSKVKSRDCLGK